MRKLLVEEYEHQVIDPETGEVNSYTKHKEIQLKKAEPFFLTYSKQIMALYSTDVLNATTKVLYKMLDFSEWNTGKVYMTADRVEDILCTCGISRASYHRAIKELIGKGIITKGKGSYAISENMFWKGDLKMRDKVINAKMQITFTPIFQEKEKKEGEEE